MSKLEEQKALPRRALYRVLRVTKTGAEVEFIDQPKPKRKAKKAKRK